ncbi:MAG: DUF4390 domain-containing protein [Xanthomonadales bacterium]|nr:DUF4390 domain-containing protein [Xanthomonadales bacterium]
MLLLLAPLMLACRANNEGTIHPTSAAQPRWYLHLQSPSAQRHQRMVMIRSGFDLQLSPDMEQALHQGIPLHLTVDTRAARYRRFWAWLVSEQKQQWRIQYLPLSRQYALTAPDGARSTYSRLRHLRAALKTPHQFALALPEPARLDVPYQVQIRAHMDIQALPSPLRLPALFSPQWHLASGWNTWLLDPV